jgi:hypothetical protein
VGGLVLVAVGVGLLVSADLHDEWRKLDRIEAAIRGDALPDARTVVLSAAEPPGGDGAQTGHRPTTSGRGISLAQLAAVSHGVSPALTLSQADGLAGRLGRAGSVVAAGAVVVAAGWWRSAETSDFDTAVGGAGWAAAGLLIAIVAIATYLVSTRGRLGERKSTLLGDWLLAGMAAERRQRQAGVRSGAVQPRKLPVSQVLVVDGGRRYHRAGCPALAHGTSSAVAVDQLDPAMVPCGICVRD